MMQTSLIKTACADVAAMISASFSDLTVFFIPYEEGFEQNAFEEARDRIFSHPCADMLFQSFAAAPKPFDPNKPAIIGPFQGNRASLSFFSQKRAFAACIFIPLNRFKRPAHTSFHLLAAAYPVITDLYHDTRLCAALPGLSQAQLARHNMLGDWFGALGGQLWTKRPFVKELAKLRCQQALSAEIHAMPELFPAPLAYDAASLIFEEQHAERSGEDPLLSALLMTEEIDSIIPAHFIGKWIDFTGRAQKLAWGSTAPQDILGMALHTSEDLDIRAISGIVADTLKIKPKLSTYAESYNPFTEDEVNQRHHKNAAQALLKTISWSIKRAQPFDFKSAFHTQNMMLIKHHPLGWCAPSIEALTKEILSIKGQFSLAAPEKKMENQLALLHHVFTDRFEQLRWAELLQVFELIHAQKRRGFCFTGLSLVTLLRAANLPQIELFERVFLPYGEQVLYDFSQIHAGEHDEALSALELEEAV